MGEKSYVHSYVRLTNELVKVDGKLVDIEGEGQITNNEKNNEKEWLHKIYKHIGFQYPKFFKMDNLCKLGFLSTELLLKGEEREEKSTDWSILLFNSSSSLDDDKQYQLTIQDEGNYYPSPSVFVYTLSNIVTGEIAIRHKFCGESCTYILPKYDAECIYEVGMMNLSVRPKGEIVIGWVDYLDGKADALLFHVNNQEENSLFEWSEFNIHRNYC